MAEFGPEIVDSVLAACRAGADEIGVTLSRALDALITVTVGEPSACGPSSPPSDCNGPGLITVLEVDSVAAVLVIPQSSGLLPDWCADPDKENENRLAAMARELALLCLPETVTSQVQRSFRVDDIATAFVAGGFIDGTALVPLELEAESGQKGTASLVWPLTTSRAIESGRATASYAPAVKPTVAKPAATPADKPTRPSPAEASSPREFPSYTRSLLKIRVPVMVTLARKKQAMGRILELGAGSIIHFDKSCEEMLELEVNGRPVAQGEPVKIGDKFGLRIVNVQLPPEQFKPIHP